MKKRQSIVFCKSVVAVTVITVGMFFVSCDVFMPNFLIGTWHASGVHGDEKLVFTKDGDFSAQFYTEEGKVQKISGKYRAGKSSIQLRYKNKEGKHVKSIALYTMYSRSMDFIIRGKKTKFYKF